MVPVRSIPYVPTGYGYSSGRLSSSARPLLLNTDPIEIRLLAPFGSGWVAPSACNDSTACRRAANGERQVHSMIQASFRLVAPEGKRQEFRNVLLHVKGPDRGVAGVPGLLDMPGHRRRSRVHLLGAVGYPRGTGIAPPLGEVPEAPSLYRNVGEASGSQLWQHRASPWDRVPGWGTQFGTLQ